MKRSPRKIPEKKVLLLVTVAISGAGYVFLLGFLNVVVTTESGLLCGNGFCGQGETPENCPQDCMPGQGSGQCGNGICESGEDPLNCPQDCAVSFETTESLLRSFFDDSLNFPATVNLFDRSTVSLGPESKPAEMVFQKEKLRAEFSGQAGTLEFSTDPSVGLSDGGYAFMIDGDSDRVTLYAKDSRGFSDAMLELFSVALQSNGFVPEGLFMNPGGYAFEFRGFSMDFDQRTAGDLNNLYEAGRLYSLLGLEEMQLRLRFARLDLRGLEGDYPGVVMFEDAPLRPTPYQVRQEIMRLKEAYPIQVHPHVFLVKAGSDHSGLKDGYKEQCGLSVFPSMSCIDIMILGIENHMASLVELSHYATAMDYFPFGQPDNQYIMLGTDEPYTMLTSPSGSVLSNPGEVYADYINNVIAESEVLLGNGLKFYGWHDAFYCDLEWPGGGVKPSNGCADWPLELKDAYLQDPECPEPPHNVREALADGMLSLDRDKFHPAVWIYRDYDVAEYEGVLDFFESKGFTDIICVGWGTGTGTRVDIENFSEACENKGAYGYMQTNFGSYPEVFDHLIVLGSLVAKYGHRDWMDSATEEDMGAFVNNLDPALGA